jgi:Tfp pilus tip-associated adhesin PilY1
MRNIYTAIPDGSGGISVVSFDASNASLLESHLALWAGLDASTLISYVRSLPIGAIVGSTPALMDPPSLDPPPDADYGRPDGGTTFAGQHKDRRSIIFFGANDGMIHAVDARTGYEVWAFIPYNLLPKLKTLTDGQPVEKFDYFVDSSPKIAEVKIDTGLAHEWRSLLIIGQGPGGVFYQAFDVTEAGMGVAPEQDDLAAVEALLDRFDAPNESIEFKWAFPNYNSFDPSLYEAITVSDATSGGQVRIYGDLRATATPAERTVGFTWSDPAVGPLNRDRTVNAVITGSGYFNREIELHPDLNRGGTRAGSTFYLIDVEDGTLIGNPSGSTCPTTNGVGCLDVGDIGGNMKNALQADPSAAGEVGLPVVTKAYIGDLDGKYWRLNFEETGTIAKSQMVDAGQPIFSSSALLFVGSSNVFMFFSTGSDLLPSTSPQGTGTFKLFGVQDNYPAPSATVKFTRNLQQVLNVGGVAHGERPSTAPSVAGDIVFFTTSTQSASEPCTDFSSMLYAFTYLGGAAYDTSGNDRLDANESPIIRTVAGRASAPFIVDQHLYFGAAGAEGFKVEAFGDPEDFNNGVGQVGVRVLSWREIR